MLITPSVKERILDAVISQNDITLHEIRKQLAEDEKDVSSIHRLLGKEEMTIKNLIYVPAKRNTPANIEKRKLKN